MRAEGEKEAEMDGSSGAKLEVNEAEMDGIGAKVEVNEVEVRLPWYSVKEECIHTAVRYSYTYHIVNMLPKINVNIGTKLE